VIVVLSLLEWGFRVASLFVFPAVALWAWRNGGSARLWLVTGLGLGLILILAAFVASPMGGNVLATRYGYGYTAPRSLMLHGLTLGFPLGAAAVAVQTLARRMSSRLGLYVIGVLCAGIAWILGILSSLRILVAVS
jgi:hypothetical protein